MSNSLDDTNGALVRAWHQGTAALRQNIIPGICLWIFGIIIVAGYFFVPAFHDSLESLGQLKLRWGWMFSALSTSIFGGLIPLILPRLLGRGDPRFGWGLLLSNFVFWAAKGIEVDLLYRVQAWLFGMQLNVGTIAIKTAIDQFFYVPTIGLGNVILFYLWRDCGYSLTRFRRELGPHWYRRRMLPVVISNWAIWIPAVVLIYCLPLALQLPVQNFVLCFWVLLLAIFTKRETAPEPEFI